MISRSFCLKHDFYGDVFYFLTDVAALACGREFLVSSSRELLDTMMHLLGDMKPGLCAKFKVYDNRFFFPFKWNALSCSLSHSYDSTFPTYIMRFPGEEMYLLETCHSSVPCRYTNPAYKASFIQIMSLWNFLSSIILWACTLPP